MGYSINDLKNAANLVENTMEQRSQKKAQELVDRLTGKNKKSTLSSNNKTTSSKSNNNQMGHGWGSSGW